MKTLKITEIKWDTEGENVKIFDEIFLSIDDDDIDEYLEDENEYISNFLSNQSDWCVVDYKISEV